MNKPWSARIPRPEKVSLPAQTTCILVLDMTSPPNTPEADTFVHGLGAFLDRARTAQIPILFTSSLVAVDEPILSVLGRRVSEPLVHPDAFDKMRSAEIQEFITDLNVENLVVTGVGANHAVMNTVLGAARHFHSLAVYVPLDGTHSSEFYTYEYAMYQLSHLPRSARPPRFTGLSLIDFVVPADAGL